MVGLRRITVGVEITGAGWKGTTDRRNSIAAPPPPALSVHRRAQRRPRALHGRAEAFGDPVAAGELVDRPDRGERRRAAGEDSLGEGAQPFDADRVDARDELV